MTYQFITSEQGDDGIVVVTINDPDAKNAVNWVMNIRPGSSSSSTVATM